MVTDTIEKFEEIEEVDTIVIRFAGDSGDGMQTVGERFTDSSALAGNDIATYPDFPAEIRAPQGTLPGVSGFQVHFGSTEILTSGDAPDALVAMNPAALKVNLKDLIDGGLLIMNKAAFTPDNLKKAGYESNPIEDVALGEKYNVVAVDITQLTVTALADTELRPPEKAKCKNFFALGFVYWVYDRNLNFTLDWIASKWASKPHIVDANTLAVKAGYHFGETTEIQLPRYRVTRAVVEPGLYRKISGNEAVTLGLIASSQLSNRELFLGSYPITPASSILEGLAKYKNFRVKTVQAEDEIAAIGMALGAAFAGSLAVTTTSGPGLCLKGEFMGLAMITELPLIIINVQRGGPSTGLPTKTEQTDLLQAMYGRNGESPMPVIAASSPADCFNTTIEAARIALKYRTPVILLSEAYIAMGSEPWLIPDTKELPDISVDSIDSEEPYIPYKRDPSTLARQLALPGRPGMEHRLGGLEKDENGSVCYDGDNHQKMCELRAAKVAGIAKDFPPIEVNGPRDGKILVIGWGGSYGAITAAVNNLRREGLPVASIHLRHVNPLPLDLADIMKRYDHVLLPELNLGQLAMVIRSRYLVDVESLSKVMGQPFKVSEIEERIKTMLKRSKK